MQSWLDVKKSDLIGTGQSNFNIITNSTIEVVVLTVSSEMTDVIIRIACLQSIRARSKDDLRFFQRD